MREIAPWPAGGDTTRIINKYTYRLKIEIRYVIAGSLGLFKFTRVHDF